MCLHVYGYRYNILPYNITNIYNEVLIGMLQYGSEFVIMGSKPHCSQMTNESAVACLLVSYCVNHTFI